MTRRSRAALVGCSGGVAAGLVAAGGAMAAPSGVAPPSPATDSAEAIRSIYWFVAVVATAVFVLVETALLVFVVRYRRRGRSREAEGPQLYGHARLEVVWTVIPAVLLATITAFTFVKLPIARGKVAAAGAVEVRVEAHQFYWQYVYSTGAITLDRLVLPLRRPVRLRITSYDVIHSWFVPAFGKKIDAIPGQTNLLVFRPLRAGTYRGQCAEFCGVLHSRHLLEVVVVPSTMFDRWLRRTTVEQQRGTSALGERTFTAVCAQCHGQGGEGGVGPAIAANPQLRERSALVSLLKNGQDSEGVPGYMPAVGRGWPDRQYEALLRYLRRR